PDCIVPAMRPLSIWTTEADRATIDARTIKKASLTRAEAREHFRKCFRTDVEIFADSAPQHRGWDVAVTALLLRLVQDVQHYPLFAGKSVADVGDTVVGMGIARIHK